MPSASQAIRTEDLARMRVLFDEISSSRGYVTGSEDYNALAGAVIAAFKAGNRDYRSLRRELATQGHILPDLQRAPSTAGFSPARNFSDA
jgi:hypothetical protein